jgi:hypothetical protein
MAKSNLKRKTRSDKSALTLHPTGQFCKKINSIPNLKAIRKVAISKAEKPCVIFAARRLKPADVYARDILNQPQPRPDW